MRAKNLALTARPSRKCRLFWTSWPPVTTTWRSQHAMGAAMRGKVGEDSSAVAWSTFTRSNSCALADNLVATTSAG